jgi:hypothetical protein
MCCAAQSLIFCNNQGEYRAFPQDIKTNAPILTQKKAVGSFMGEKTQEMLDFQKKTVSLSSLTKPAEARYGKTEHRTSFTF